LSPSERAPQLALEDPNRAFLRAHGAKQARVDPAPDGPRVAAELLGHLGKAQEAVT
jgi:hypothetical protein